MATQTLQPGSVPANALSRRGLIGALATAPVLAGCLAACASPGAAQQGAEAMNMHTTIAAADVTIWEHLVAEYHRTRAAWLAVCGAEDDAMETFEEACALLAPEPRKPDSGLPVDILDMTVRQIRAVSDDPSYTEAWATYEREHAVWKEERDALRERFVGPAKASYHANYAAFAAAFNALTDHRSASLDQLREKIEVISLDYAGEDVPQAYVDDIREDVMHLASRDDRSAARS